MLIILSGLVSAQTVSTTYFTKQELLVLDTPCVNNGRGELISWTGKVFIVQQVKTDVNGVRSGVIYYTSTDLVGRGLNSGRAYTMKGSNVKSWQNVNADLFNLDGANHFVITFGIHSKFENIGYYNDVELITSQGGTVLTFPQGFDGLTVCK